MSMVVHVKKLAVSSPVHKSIFRRKHNLTKKQDRVIPAIYKGGSEQEDEDISLHRKHNNN